MTCSRALKAAAAAVLALAILAGCGSGSTKVTGRSAGHESEASTSITVTTAPAPSATTTTAPVAAAKVEPAGNCYDFKNDVSFVRKDRWCHNGPPDTEGKQHGNCGYQGYDPDTQQTVPPPPKPDDCK